MMRTGSTPSELMPVPPEDLTSVELGELQDDLLMLRELVVLELDRLQEFSHFWEMPEIWEGIMDGQKTLNSIDSSLKTIGVTLESREALLRANKKYPKRGLVKVFAWLLVSATLFGLAAFASMGGRISSGDEQSLSSEAS